MALVLLLLHVSFDIICWRVFWQLKLDPSLLRSADHIVHYTIQLSPTVFSFWFIFRVYGRFPTLCNSQLIYILLYSFIVLIHNKQFINLRAHSQIILKEQKTVQYNQMPDNKGSLSVKKRKVNKSLKKDQLRTRRKNSSDSSMDEEQQLNRQNNRLRRQLVKLSKKLDDIVEKASKNKVKAIISPVITTTKQSQHKQLEVAEKMIDRLQKTIQDYESKQAYIVSFRRITDLEEIIRKKQIEIEKLQSDIKYGNRDIKARNLVVNQLLSQQQAPINVNQNKQKIQHLQLKIRKLFKENQYLSKKQNAKQEKLFIAESKMHQLEWNDGRQIGRSQILLKKVELAKQKYKTIMDKVDKQNIEITTLNIRLSQTERSIRDKRKRPPGSYSHNSSNPSPRQISKSLEQLPSIRSRKQSLVDILPNLPRRYN